MGALDKILREQGDEVPEPHGVLVKCIHDTLPCCFKNKRGKCKILVDTDFKDGVCHFRKLSVTGENLYDKIIKEETKRNPS